MNIIKYPKLNANIGFDIGNGIVNILLENGSLYLCGTDVLNLLGTDSIKWKEQHKFMKMTLLENEFFTQIACAEFHTLCLNDKGEVFTWGGSHSVIIYKIQLIINY